MELLANRLDPRPDGWRVRWRDESRVRCLRRAVQAASSLPGGPFVYVGDGYSDRCAALAADRVFARDGLATYLDEQGVPYERFETSSTSCSPFELVTQCYKLRFALGDDAGVPLLGIPQPYDFDALDRALPRVRARPREPLARGRAAPRRRRAGGADRGGAGRRPRRAARRRDRAEVVASSSALPFDLDAFYRARDRPGRSRDLVAKLAGFRPPLAPDPFESLVTSITAQQVSLFAGVRDPQPDDRALRRARRARLRVPDARGDRRRATRTSSSRSASRAARRSTSSGSRGRTSTSTRSPRSPTTRSRRGITAVRGLGEWTADWFLARHLARPRAWRAGRPRPAQGGRRLLW